LPQIRRAVDSQQANLSICHRPTPARWQHANSVALCAGPSPDRERYRGCCAPARATRALSRGVLGALGEPPHGLLVVGVRDRPVGWLGLGGAKAVAVTSHATLNSLAQVLPEVKPVRDLHRVRGSETSSLGVGPGAVSAYHLHPGMRSQPVRQGLSVSARQQLQRCAGLAVDQYGAVVLAAPQCEVVHSQHPWSFQPRDPATPRAAATK
jgi:hypothetical protein